MPQMNHCNRCQRGVFEFIGHQYDVKKDKCVSVSRCTECGTLDLRPWNYSFDIEHPKAINGMLPTDDYQKRIFKGWTPSLV
jgi:hypothetical protein